MNTVLYDYPDKELTNLLKSIIILVDSRENKNDHITDYFTSKKISYKVMGLGSADYSFLLPKNESLGIARDLYFYNIIAIERKASLEELANNLSNERQRFEDELLRSHAQIILLVESGSNDDIMNHKYNTLYNEKSFIGTIISYQARYNMIPQFVKKENAGKFIYMTLHYYLREYLKNGGIKWVRS